MRKTLTLFAFMLSFGVVQAQSELILDNSYTVEEMIIDFFDNPMITPFNVTYSGGDLSYSFFDAGDSDLEVNAGILITSGLAYDPVSGIGVNQAASVFLSDQNNEGNDGDMETLGNAASFNACIIEFDFTAETLDTFSFQYVFGSEEYPEYACSAFNDVYGFFISGPNIVGPFENGAINISTLPGTSTPITINEIHPENGPGCPAVNEQYYVNNEFSEDVVYDGLTTQLPASFTMAPLETYHAKIVISDIGDGVFDSGVFIGYNSLGNGDSLVPPTIFELVSNGANSFEVFNDSKYARTYNWDFGNGTFSDERYPGEITYNALGTYTVKLTTENYCCTNVYEQTIEVTELSIPLSVQADVENNPLACFGDSNASLTFSVEGGQPPYLITWNPIIADPEMLSVGEYNYVVVDASGEEISGSILVTQPDELVLTPSYIPSTNGQADATANINPIGGTPPYSYLWSTGSEEAGLENILPGLYTVTVTDQNGCVQSGSVNVGSTTSLTIIENSQIEIYPNPVIDQLELKGISRDQIERVNLFDINGQEHNINLNNLSLELDKAIKAGVYILQLQLQNQQQVNLRFIKI